MVAVKEQRSGFSSSPFKYWKEPFKAEYLKILMDRTDMDDFLVLYNLEMFFFSSIIVFLDFRSCPVLE